MSECYGGEHCATHRKTDTGHVLTRVSTRVQNLGMTTNRDPRLDRLAIGSNCHACGAYADEPCRTRRTGRETAPHQARIDRAVSQYVSAR